MHSDILIDNVFFLQQTVKKGLGSLSYGIENIVPPTCPESIFLSRLTGKFQVNNVDTPRILGGRLNKK